MDFKKTRIWKKPLVRDTTTPGFLQKSSELLENKRVEFFADAKEWRRV